MIIMTKQHDWIIQLCDCHAVKFSASYYAFQTIQEALRSKKSCTACKLDMPKNILKVDITFDEGEESWDN